MYTAQSEPFFCCGQRTARAVHQGLQEGVDDVVVDIALAVADHGEAPEVAHGQGDLAMEAMRRGDDGGVGTEDGSAGWVGVHLAIKNLGLGLYTGFLLERGGIYKAIGYFDQLPF
jgi:hypothetical protein